MGLATITIQRGATIFLIEDSDERVAWFENKLGLNRPGGYAINGWPVKLFVTSSPSQALTVLKAADVNDIDLFFFDHDLGGAPYTPPFATEIADYLVTRDSNVGKRVVIHSMNIVGSKNLQRIMPGAVHMPFGTFDLKLKEKTEW